MSNREGVLVFDLETDSVDTIHDGNPGFVRLAGYAWGNDPVIVTSDIGELVAQIDRAAIVIGHNIVGFDLAALHRYHSLDVDVLVDEGRVVDLLLVARQVDPPMAQGADGRRYSLDVLGRRLLGEGKLAHGDESALKALSEEFGGFGQIPVDDERYRAYAAQDVELTRAIARHPSMRVDDYARREARVMWRFGVIERAGVRIDEDAARRAVAQHEARRADLLEVLHTRYEVPRTGGASPHTTTAGKDAIEACLTGMGVEVPRTRTGALATSRAALDGLLERYPEHAVLGELVGVIRALGEKTFADQALKHLHSDGRVHPKVSAEQATGRLSITQPALTTAGKRSERLVAQRAVVVPDADDEVLVAADLSGIDACALGLVSGDPGYITAAASDYHNTMAATVFGPCGWSPESGVAHPRRKDAKILVHGINYGMGPRAAAAQASVGIEEAQTVIARLEAAYPGLAAWRAGVRAEAEMRQVLRTSAGRMVRCTPGRSWTQAPAFMGQSTARDLLAAGVLRMSPWLASRIRLLVHDEIVVSVPRERVEEAVAELVDAMQLGGQGFVEVEGAPPVYVRAEASPPGESWAECYREEGS